VKMNRNYDMIKFFRKEVGCEVNESLEVAVACLEALG